jgi:integrase
MFDTDYKHLNPVFSQPDGSYLDPALVSQTIVRRMRKAGSRMLRFTPYATLTRADCYHRKFRCLRARLGHANTNITASIHAHALPADDQKAADKWYELITRKVQ